MYVSSLGSIRRVTVSQKVFPPVKYREMGRQHHTVLVGELPDLEIAGHPVILTDRKFLTLQKVLGDSRLLRQFIRKLKIKNKDICRII